MLLILFVTAFLMVVALYVFGPVYGKCAVTILSLISIFINTDLAFKYFDAR